jgi:hypothetical protein
MDEPINQHSPLVPTVAYLNVLSKVHPGRISFKIEEYSVIKLSRGFNYQ